MMMNTDPNMTGQGMGDPGVMGANPELMQYMMGQPPPPPEPITSPLDMWSMRMYKLPATQLDENQMQELVVYVGDLAQKAEKFWEPRDKRMMESQRFWELNGRYGKGGPGKAAHDFLHPENDKGEGLDSEVVELNDAYLTVDKITSMVSGANWGIDVPPLDPKMDDIAQSIEDLLRWADDELDKKHSLALNAGLVRDQTHYACLRGWITGMIIPNPDDPDLPWTDILEDPIFVYPRFSGQKLLYVAHRYRITALEGASEFPQAFDYFMNLKDEEEVTVTSYYDDVYRITLITEGGAGKDSKSGSRFIIQPLAEHGYRDMRGRRINPWIIVTPRGSPTRRFDRTNSSLDHEKSVAMIGLDVIFPVINTLQLLEKTLSMQLTEMAKGVEPPHIIYYDGSNKPEMIDFGIGAENYLILGREQVEVLNTTTMKPDASPVINAANDRLQRGTIPSVLYGQTGFTLAGYAINLLTQGAKDVADPILKAVKLFRELRFQRMLEMYVNIGSMYNPELQFGGYDKVQDRQFSGSKKIDAMSIKLNGSKVNVTYDDLMPRDLAQIVPVIIGAVQAGILPIYDAMKQIGIKDPKQALQRLAESKNYQDPLVVKYLARIAGSMSGSQLLQAAIMLARQEEAMMMMQQQQMQQMAMQQQAEKGSPRPPGGATNNEEGGEPARESPITAATNQLDAVGASLNTSNGGSPPSG